MAKGEINKHESETKILEKGREGNHISRGLQSK